jgi:AraC-like DNA-binding protein
MARQAAFRRQSSYLSRIPKSSRFLERTMISHAYSPERPVTVSTLESLDWYDVARHAGFQPSRMASICQLSLRQLERYFEKYLNATPRTWVREARCRRAVKLLVKGYSNKAVVAELNFASEPQLCRDFKKVFGDSPQAVARVFALRERLPSAAITAATLQPESTSMNGLPDGLRRERPGMSFMRNNVAFSQSFEVDRYVAHAKG